LLTVDERQAVLETALDEVNGRAAVVAHVGAFQTADTLTLAKHASEVEADAIATLPPAYFYKPDDLGLVRCYTAVAEVSDVPLLVYNIPQRTGISMTRDLFDQLLEVPNIIGMKDSSGDIYSLGLYFAGGKTPVIFEGDDSVVLHSWMVGACGGIGGSYNIMPQLFTRLWGAYQAGDMEGAVNIQLRINELINALLVVDTFGGIKQTMAWMGLECGVPRTPNRPLTEEETSRLRRSLEGVGFFEEV